MVVLLDTDAFIWWIADDASLGERARADIANPRHQVYVSNLSLFECAIKVRLGKLKIDFEAVDTEISEGRIGELRFDTLSARQLANQEDLKQADPFDAAIIAQAVSKKMTLITSDHHILRAQVRGLYVQDATK